MIDRYTRPEMAAVWAEEEKLRLWLEVELLALEALAERGEIPYEVPVQLRAHARVNVERMRAIEREVGHDVIAFVSSVTEKCGPEGRYMHLGLTSSDVLDTAFAVQLGRAADLLIQGATELADAIRVQAQMHRGTVMVGRTHGIHAEPITFGVKLAGWYTEMRRNVRRLEAAATAVRFGKISGAVGTFAHLAPEIEAFVCRRLGLQPEPVATQVVPRDRHAQFFTTLAIVAGSVERFATEIRHLQRSEVREAEEPFTGGQKGSSAMPHKRNPVLCENVTGLARLLRAYAGAALEDIALWHERDISHSSVERVIAPDATIALHFMLHRMSGTVRGLVVHTGAMAANLERSRGAVFSEAVLLALVRKGVARDQAYRWVQRAGLRALEGADFRIEVAQDADITRHISAAELAELFDLRHQLRYEEELFQRAFGGE
ncbi:MAG: Adenylosuccinate lyase [Deltaproteobacteria bacterium]|jgi:adenylosuccinate lyase|nr:Adenylosuccinate lyase [Deltaproteobacteria bacterium]